MVRNSKIRINIAFKYDKEKAEKEAKERKKEQLEQIEEKKRQEQEGGRGRTALVSMPCPSLHVTLFRFNKRRKECRICRETGDANSEESRGH